MAGLPDCLAGWLTGWLASKLVQIFVTEHDAFYRASCRATLGPLFAQVALLRGYDLRQSVRLKLISSYPAGRMIGLGNSGLSAPDYFCPAIFGEKLEATDTRWLMADGR